MTRSYVCDRCWENKCQHCGHILFADTDDGTCAMCGTPHQFAIVGNPMVNDREEAR